MYLHVGNNENIRIKDIIGIFDADTATVSSITKKYLLLAQKKKCVRSAVEEIPKSFILYIDCYGDYKICFSQISTSALIGRIQSII